MSQATSINSNSHTKIEKGSLILVAGGGFLSCAIIHQFLVDGYRVRVTTRTLSKLDEMKKAIEMEFGEGRFEVVEVKDLTRPDVLQSALKDCSGIIHVGSVTSEVGDLDKDVKDVVAMTEEILRSAAATPSIKSFVLTSSRIAICNPKGDSEYREYSDKDWHEEAYDVAAKEENPVNRPLLVYAATKVAGEKAFWSFVEKEKPKFRVNTVNPDVVFGKIYNPAPGFYSTASFLQLYARGEPGFEMFLNYPTYFVEVDDTAKLHVAALVDETVSNQRILAASAPYSASLLQETFKAINPDHGTADVSNFPRKANLKLDNSIGTKLLEKHYGKGFNDLKFAVEANNCFKA